MSNIRTIWKYPIPMQDQFTIRLPKGAIVRHINTQYDEPQMWVEVTEDTTYFEDRNFYQIGTGHRLDMTRLDHIGTYLMHDGGLVFHVYEDVIKDG